MFCAFLKKKGWLTNKSKLWTLEQYKLDDNFSRIKCNYGGMCTSVRDDLYVKEVKYPKELCSEKESEMSAVKLVEFK